MIRQTLLQSLYFEISPEKIPEVIQTKAKDRFFHTLERSYPSVPEITAVTMEERYLPYSVLYYIFVHVHGVRMEGELTDPAVARWILEFYRENHKDYLKEEYREAEETEEAARRIDILDCFEVFNIPSYRKHKYAYADMEFIRYEDVHNKEIVREDDRQAAFPGISFTKKYRETGNE
ncbi:MAG: hypothetical protein IKX76_06795 [Eubacterium sp.]|nr:hypothetical protein [Eubacterium sp.]